MKKNVLTIFAITGTISLYLLYKYRRRIIKILNFKKPMGRASDINSEEKENNVYELYVDDSSLVFRVDPDKENISSSRRKNSITENIIKLEGNHLIQDFVPPLYFDLELIENSPIKSNGGINLTKLNMPKPLNSLSYEDKSKFNNCQLNNPDMKFLEMDVEDDSDLQFLNPSTISLGSNCEIVDQIFHPQNGDTVITLVQPLNNLNLKDLNDNVNTKNMRCRSTNHLDKDKENSVYKNIDRFNDNGQENLSPTLDLVNDNIDTRRIDSHNFTQLNGDNHLDFHTEVNGIENAYSNTEENCDLPRVVDEPNLSNNVENAESSTGVKSKKNKCKRKKKNSDGNSSLGVSNSQNNVANGIENVYSNSDKICDTPSVIDEPNLSNNVENVESSSDVKSKKRKRRRKKKNGDGNSSSGVSSSQNTGNSTPIPSVDEMLPNNEIINVYHNSSCNPCDTVNLDNNDVGSSVCVEAYSMAEGNTIFDGTVAFEGTTTSEELVAFEGGAIALDNYHLDPEINSSSLRSPEEPCYSVLEPQNLAAVDSTQDLPNMDGNGYDTLPNDQGYSSLYPSPYSLTLYEYNFEIHMKHVGKLIGKDGSFKKILKEMNVEVLIHNPTNSTSRISICELKAPTAEEMNAGLEVIRERFPVRDYSRLTLENITPYQIPTVSLNQMVIPSGVCLGFCVSHVQSVGEVWVQQPKSVIYPKFMEMIIEMGKTYKDGSAAPKMRLPIADSTFAVCRIEEDWYRCLVVKSDNISATVHLVDIGSYINVPIDELRQPSKDLNNLPTQAVFVHLYGLEPPSGLQTYPPEGARELINLVQNFTLITTVELICGQTGSPVVKFYIKDEVTNEYIYVNKVLVDRGLARWSDYVEEDEK